MRLILAFFVIVQMALPAVCQEGWPDATTPKLEVAGAGIAVKVPAPQWIDEAMSEPGYESEDGIEASWFVGGGFDARGSSLNVTIQTLDAWEQGAQQHSFGYGASSCETLAFPELSRAEDVFEFTVLCGRDYGTGRGVIYYGQARQAGNDHVVDVWYVTEVEPFNAGDEATWPMPPNQLIAMWERLRAAITVEGP
jgi:hypothetical protein